MSYVSNECLEDCKKCTDLLCSHSCHNLEYRTLSKTKERDKKTENKKKYILISLQETNGEFEYEHRIPKEIPIDKDIYDYASEYTKDFYGGGSEADEKPEGSIFTLPEAYYFDNGEIYVQITDVCELKKTEYDILKKYI